MKTVKFAAIFMGKDFTSKEHHVSFQNLYNDNHFYGVDNLDEACALAQALLKDGYECLELCGAFGEEGARAVIEATGNKMAVGYSIHFPEQDKLFEKVFG